MAVENCPWAREDAAVNGQSELVSPGPFEVNRTMRADEDRSDQICRPQLRQGGSSSWRYGCRL